MSKLGKVFRFVRLYGLGKTLFKVVGRSRDLMPFFRPRVSKDGRDVGVIGCGQFAFATIGYALWKEFGNRFVNCYDIAPDAQYTFAKFYGIASSAASARDLITDPMVRFIYIASNHASHAEYAIESLAAGKVTYIEKPIAVTHAQLAQLCLAVRQCSAAVFAGYNRPFSGAIRGLRQHVGRRQAPVTLTCFVSGHMIPADHWYRNPGEGSRVCGNIGHWLDLAIHILSWGVLPDRWTIHLAFSNVEARDDNLSISLTSSEGDLVVIVLTARCEPFEGINETINFQCGETIAKIDDFRRMRVWKGEKVFSHRYWPKDVGHNLALLQPFSSVHREWEEVVRSSLLMLSIMEMVVAGKQRGEFSFAEELRRLERAGETAAARVSAVGS